VRERESARERERERGREGERERVSTHACVHSTRTCTCTFQDDVSYPSMPTTDTLWVCCTSAGYSRKSKRSPTPPTHTNQDERGRREWLQTYQWENRENKRITAAGVAGATKKGLRVSASGRGGRQAMKRVGEGDARAGGRGARKSVKRRNGAHASPTIPSPLKYIKRRPRSSNLNQKRRGNLLLAQTNVSISLISVFHILNNTEINSIQVTCVLR
jgi:hypothetical protein